MIGLIKKLYYAIITPILIIGFIFPASQNYLLLVLILVSGYFTWIEYEGKLKNAEGEEELRKGYSSLNSFSVFRSFIYYFTYSLINIGGISFGLCNGGFKKIKATAVMNYREALI